MTTLGMVVSACAPKCANTATTRISASHRNAPKITRTRCPRFASAMSAMDRPRARSEAIKLEKSCTAPRNTDPTTTQIRAGAHPHTAHASTGPTIGPTPAMLAK